jgi:hypothetical protein
MERKPELVQAKGEGASIPVTEFIRKMGYFESVNGIINVFGQVFNLIS